MISGRKSSSPSRLSQVRWCLVGLALLAGPAWSLELEGLMSLLSQRKSGEARFTEERFVSGLSGPLLASGRLTFAAPDRFARYTLQPRVESMEVEGNRVLLKRGSRSVQMALDAVPELAVLSDAMRGTLNGDAQTLQRHFRAEVSGTDKQWTLILTPLDSRLAGQVSQLEIGGVQADVRSIELTLSGGDRSLMRVEPLTAVQAGPGGP